MQEYVQAGGTLTFDQVRDALDPRQRRQLRMLLLAQGADMQEV